MVLDANKNGIPDNLEVKAGQGTPQFTPRTPAIQLPGIDGGLQATEAYGWFKLVAAKAPKGSVVRDYYDNFVNQLTAFGIPKSKWNSVWKDAVDWTQTPGSGSTGIPAAYLASLDPADYAGGAGGKKYGTSKSKDIRTTKYSASSAAADINKFIESEIGRTATKEEIDAYQAGVNAEAAKSPAISEFTTTTSPGTGGLLQTSVTKGVQSTGFDPTIYAQNFARSRPDFAESFATKAVLGIIQKVLRDPNAIGRVVE